MLKVLDEDCPMFFLIYVKVLQYLGENLTFYKKYVSLNALNEYKLSLWGKVKKRILLIPYRRYSPRAVRQIWLDSRADSIVWMKKGAAYRYIFL